MFTGLIREMASVTSFNNNILEVKAEYRPKVGDSIAINGACLTVVDVKDNSFCVELSPESQSVLVMKNYVDKVHIEPAMMMGDRFEGHIVQGHVDCIGTITSIIENGNSTDFFISLPDKHSKFVISKGSVTIDGVSLTINEVLKDSFRLTIIPHTIENTLFQNYTVNSQVNVETDMFARYIHNMIKPSENSLEWADVDKIMSSY